MFFLRKVRTYHTIPYIYGYRYTVPDTYPNESSRPDMVLSRTRVEPEIADLTWNNTVLAYETIIRIEPKNVRVEFLHLERSSLSVLDGPLPVV
jgi:hypothetical protein